jgi:predicted glycoside hydrolase/deacetylase ChbG (UPF0249 family)
VRPAGKFLFAGPQKLVVRGVTYGTFQGPHGLPERGVVAADFVAMIAAGVNTVRTYTPPPPWLLELAADAGLRVLVGIAWEQHLAFLGERHRRRAIGQSVQAAVRASRGHPAVLGYVIGNEIPPSIVRWHGRVRVERFIEYLYRTAKAEDPEAIVTYASYPSTEFLHLPFLDVACFNVFLEERQQMRDYLARLQVLAGDRPLIISELGACSAHQGPLEQAASIEWQLETVFAVGCAGSFVFAWTDEWSRAGEEIDDWDFGVVDRAREPKPALAALQRAYGRVPFAPREEWPGVSVVLCTYNGAKTIGGSVDALMRLDYPNYEAIVVDDGSTDGAGEIAETRGARVIRTPNAGLSAARNTGIQASHGEIIVFCDDDCRPDRDWLKYLVSTFESGDCARAGTSARARPRALRGDHRAGRRRRRAGLRGRPGGRGPLRAACDAGSWGALSLEPAGGWRAGGRRGLGDGCRGQRDDRPGRVDHRLRCRSRRGHRRGLWRLPVGRTRRGPPAAGAPVAGLGSGLGTARRAPARLAGRSPDRRGGTRVSERQLIVNADDFGRSAGTNAGIIEAHEQGIVTSTSLMVRWPAAELAGSYARAHAELSVGLHVDLTEYSYRDGEWVLVYENAPAESEIGHQLGRFRALIGRDPTHVDSHQHVHRDERIGALCVAVAEALGVPLRERAGIEYCGSFYGQSGKGYPVPEAIEVEALIGLIEGLPEGVTELGCHPGLDAELDSSYRDERLKEVQTLCDPRVREAIDRAGVQLRPFRPCATPGSRSHPDHGGSPGTGGAPLP